MTGAAWRVVYDDGGYNTFDTDPQKDGARALAAFAEECESGTSPRLQYRRDGVEWMPEFEARGLGGCVR